MAQPAPTLEDLLGLPWWCLGRAGNMQWFHFGRRRMLGSASGVAREVGDYALHVQAPWRVCSEGKIVLGSHDLSFPRGTSRLDEVPEDYDWQTHPTRLDEVADALQQQLLPRGVAAVKLGSCGAITLTVDGGLTLEIFPNAATESESWRLFVPGDHEREHLVDESYTHADILPGLSRSLDPVSRATLYTRAHAAIRFTGATLDPLDVTRVIRLPYTRSHRDGEPRIHRRRSDCSVNEYDPYRGGMWTMSSQSWVRSSDLDAHVRWLLGQLEPRAHQLEQLLSTGIVGDIFCFCSGAPAAPPTLPASTLARAAALGLTIEIDYYGDDEPD